MRARAATIGTLVALVGFGAGGSFAVAGEFTPPKQKNKKSQKAKPSPTPAPTSPGQSQYGTRPGKGCGDRNHVHTGPPGNPSNTECPNQAGSKKSSGKRKAASCKTGKTKARSNAKSKARNKKASKRSESKSCKRASSKANGKKNGKGKKRGASRRSGSRG